MGSPTPATAPTMAPTGTEDEEVSVYGAGGGGGDNAAPTTEPFTGGSKGGAGEVLSGEVGD